MLFAQLLKSTLLKQTQRDSAEIVVREFLLFSEKADIPTRPKVTNHSNSQEKFEINEKKILDEEQRLSVCGENGSADSYAILCQ